MNLKNVAVLKVPSMISQWRMPCLRDSAERTEYFEGADNFILCSMYDSTTLTFFP